MMIRSLELPMAIISTIDGKRVRSRISVELLDEDHDKIKNKSIYDIISQEYDRRAVGRTSISRTVIDI